MCMYVVEEDVDGTKDNIYLPIMPGKHIVM